jgi:hypothetical protein
MVQEQLDTNPLLIRFNAGLQPHVEELRNVLARFVGAIETGAQNSAAGAYPSAPPPRPPRAAPRRLHAASSNRLRAFLRRRGGRTMRFPRRRFAARPARAPQLTKDAPRPRPPVALIAGKVCCHDGVKCPQGCVDPIGCTCEGHRHKLATSLGGDRGGALFWGWRGAARNNYAQSPLPLEQLPRAPHAVAPRAFPRTPPRPAHLTHIHSLTLLCPPFLQRRRSPRRTRRRAVRTASSAASTRAPCSFQRACIARPPRPTSHTTHSYDRFHRPLFAAAAANVAIAAKKEAAPPPTAEQQRAIERMQELLKQERLKKAGGGS